LAPPSNKNSHIFQKNQFDDTFNMKDQSFVEIRKDEIRKTTLNPEAEFEHEIGDSYNSFKGFKKNDETFV
jgi:hypothetical protein